MAAWCFVCDGPVEGDRCPRCGRPGTPVEEERPGPRRRMPEIRIPPWVWLVVAALLVLALFPLLQGGLGLD